MAALADDPLKVDARRERILRATIEVIKERGFSGTRVADIAAEAGTSQGLVLYHFTSLAGALSAAVAFMEDEYYGVIDVAAAHQGSPRERLRLMAETAVGAGPSVGEWRLYLEIWARALHDEQVSAVRASLDARWRFTLIQVIEEGVASGDFRTADVRASAWRLACLTDGLAIQLAQEDTEITPADFVELWWGAACAE